MTPFNIAKVLYGSPITMVRTSATSEAYFTAVRLPWYAHQILHKRTSRQSDYHGTHINYFASVLYGSPITIVRTSATSQAYFSAVWLPWYTHQLLRKRTSRQSDYHGTHINFFASALRGSLITMVRTSATSQTYFTAVRLSWYAHHLLLKRTLRQSDYHAPAPYSSESLDNSWPIAGTTKGQFKSQFIYQTLMIV